MCGVRCSFWVTILSYWVIIKAQGLPVQSGVFSCAVNSENNWNAWIPALTARRLINFVTAVSSCLSTVMRKKEKMSQFDPNSEQEYFHCKVSLKYDTNQRFNMHFLWRNLLKTLNWLCLCRHMKNWIILSCRSSELQEPDCLHKSYFSWASELKCVPSNSRKTNVWTHLLPHENEFKP